MHRWKRVLTFLRFTLVEFPQGVTTDLNTNDGSTWRVTGTPLNVIWGKAIPSYSADDYRRLLTWCDFSAMLFNGAGDAAQLMGGEISVYNAASGNNQRRVIIADEFQADTGITDDQKERMFHLNSAAWSTGWLNGDYTSLWGTDPHPVTPGNLYNVYKTNNAFVYLLTRLSETGGAGTGWSSDEALSRWADFVHDSSGNLRTKYRIIIEPGGIFVDPDGVRRAYTLREMMAYLRLHVSRPSSPVNCEKLSVAGFRRQQVMAREWHRLLTHIKAENTPPDVIVVSQLPEIIYVTPRPPVVEYPGASFPPE